MLFNSVGTIQGKADGSYLLETMNFMAQTVDCMQYIFFYINLLTLFYHNY